MSRDYVLHSFERPVHLQLDYAGELNEQQYAAVTAEPGPALVIAGAGSGKTRTLTYRVAYLLEQGIPPDRILLLTFTNKAAREMMRRVSDLLGQELQALWGGTFHSIGSRILRQHAALVGYGRDFSILDREDAKSLIGTCVEEAGLGGKRGRGAGGGGLGQTALPTEGKHGGFPKPEVLLEMFSLAVNTHQSLTEVVGKQFGHFEEELEAITALQTAYAARKRANNGMDFDDLLGLWLKLLQEHAEPREYYQRRFQFILVDEYQDTNRLQSDLIDLLAGRHRNLMVVGDDAQSIYAWRGANYQNILRFGDRYPGAKIYRIETNYRSTPEILEAANAVISANVHQFRKQLAPVRKSGSKPVLAVCADAGQQAAFVAQRALELHEEGVTLDKMAVLYRSHFHALELQLELTKRNIPFSITSGIRFFEQAHIKDVVAYLKLVANPRDELSLKRIVLLMEGVGPKAADKIWKAYQDRGQRSEVRGQRADRDGGLGQTALPGEGRRTVARMLQGCSTAVPRKAAVAWAQFLATVAQLEGAGMGTQGTASLPGTGASAANMIRLVVEAGYEEHLKTNYTNFRNRLDDLEQLAIFARQFEGLDEFLTQLALLTNIEAEEGTPGRKDEEQLRLSTVHQAKGLEFDVVFVIMLCDGLFPSGRSLEDPDGVEEERRLMYVAVTRARNELYMTYPLVRAGYGQGGSVFQERSRFLGEIPPDLVEEWNLRPYHAYE